MTLYSLRCIGIFLRGSEEDTQLAIDAGVVPELGKLLNLDKPDGRKEVAWALSNITAGNSKQIQVVLDNMLMEKIIKLAMQDTLDVRRECIWAITNASSGSSPEQAEELIRMGAVEALCWILNIKDVKTLLIALEGIEYFFRKAVTYWSEDEKETLELRIEQCGGLKAIEKLQLHPNPRIYKKALSIIEDYFGIEEEVSMDPHTSVSIFDF